MKRYIRSSTSEVKFKFIIDVFIDSPFSVHASDDSGIIDPVTNEDGSVNEFALSKWYNFVQRFATRLEKYFKVVKIEKSPTYMSLTSRYFWIYAKSADGQIATDTLVRLRLTDHTYPDGHDFNAESEYRNREGQNLKPSDKYHSQFVEPYEILIQCNELGINDKYRTYSEALKSMDAEFKYIIDEYMLDDDIYDDWGNDTTYEADKIPTSQEKAEYSKNYLETMKRQKKNRKF